MTFSLPYHRIHQHSSRWFLECSRTASATCRPCLQYNYAKIVPDEPHKPWIRRPVLELTLIGPGRTIETAAILDSSADFSVFDMQMGEALGIDLSALPYQSIVGVAGVER